MRILLTGGGGKFGAGFIERFSAEADIVALRHGLAGDELARRFVPELGELTPKIRSVACDFQDAEAIWRTVATIIGLTGPIDHVVNAAADVRFLGPSFDAALYARDAHLQMQANALAPAIIVSSVFHHDWKQRTPQDASVLNLSSISADLVYGGVGQAIYAASKAALNTLTLHLAEDLKPQGIRVNGLSPDTFPGALSTEAVVEAAMRILRGDTTGHIFQLSAKTRAAR